MHSLEIIQWDSTRRDHPGNPGRVSGSGPVTMPRPHSTSFCLFVLSFSFFFQVGPTCPFFFISQSVSALKQFIFSRFQFHIS